MGIHFNVVCDHSRHFGGAVGVDSLGETWGDMVACLRGIGWYVETEGDSRVARCLCPEHAPTPGASPGHGPGPEGA